MDNNDKFHRWEGLRPITGECAISLWPIESLKKQTWLADNRIPLGANQNTQESTGILQSFLLAARGILLPASQVCLKFKEKRQCTITISVSKTLA